MSQPVPDVSVVIPAYRAKAFIGVAIESALDQAGVRLEVIIVDDHSPDDTAVAVSQDYRTDPRVIVIRQTENGGPAKARNAGIRAAKAEWVAVLDADDAFEPDRLRRLIDAAIANDADVIADNIRFFNAQTGTLSEPRLVFSEPQTKLGLHEFVARAHPGAEGLDLGLLKPMYRKSFLTRTNLTYPTEIRHGEDFTLYFNLLKAGARFFLIPDAGYRWTLRNSGNSQTREDYPAQRREALRLAKTVKDDERLVSLLKIRGDELLRWRYRRRLQNVWESGNRLGGLLLGLRHPLFTIKRFASSAVRRLH